MRFDIMTLFPEMTDGILGESIIGRAQNSGKVEIHSHNIRDFSLDKHRRVDDTTYGGGMGMLMAAPPIYRCWNDIIEKTDCKKRKTVYMSPQGRVLTQSIAREYLDCEQIIILCGHYEGVDRRIVEEIVDDEISIGDYVLTGGELPACIFVDCVSRMLDGVLSDPECFENESIASGMLEYPQYTRPVDFMGRKVPEVLMSGNHEEIRKWRYKEALKLTKKNRPDLL
ncbi:MAG: tRNA (guanosine(37)-N1)-methyltransferase TrmD [Clostridia bacterium]|nr:tRNA (guanosine(37)-N1)-methyltransferase TrmD [Clostridia bacterium]